MRAYYIEKKDETCIKKKLGRKNREMNKATEIYS